MYYYYRPFSLDEWVSKLFIKMGINKPEDICIQTIAKKLNIYLLFSSKRSYSRVIGNFKLININNKLSAKKKREVFFHELCHVIRHEGFQYKGMTEAFRELQERDACHFIRYAAIPYHMLKYIDWSSPTLIGDMANSFSISEEICKYRVNHIKRNCRMEESVKSKILENAFVYNV
ncbi:ImmA/IrrE family metallo-endopeptidase [Bacillaceae bacterium Marseille-Q3522]|nr:ImmA/IrrE family metallo-endopeptidase [Bacillaceae bacterium Marseille-Q3522]